MTHRNCLGEAYIVCCNFLLCPVVCNRLPSSAHQVQTLSSLKSQLKTHLFSVRFKVQLNTHCVVHSGGLSGRSYLPITAKGHILDLLLLLTCSLLLLLTCSLPWWHVKTTNTSVIFCLFLFLFCFGVVLLSFSHYHVQGFSSKRTELKAEVLQDGKYTVCRRVRALFSPEAVQFGAVKGLVLISLRNSFEMCIYLSILLLCFL